MALFYCLLAENSLKTVLKRMLTFGVVFPLGGEQDGIPKNPDNIPWATTQRKPIPNFTEIQEYLSMEKLGQKWSGEWGKVGNNTS